MASVKVPQPRSRQHLRFSGGDISLPALATPGPRARIDSRSRGSSRNDPWWPLCLYSPPDRRVHGKMARLNGCQTCSFSGYCSKMILPSFLPSFLPFFFAFSLSCDPFGKMAFLEGAHVSRVPTCLFYPIHSTRELDGVVRSYALHVQRMSSVILTLM